MPPTTGRLRAVYVTDTMLDLRFLEGLAEHMDVTVLYPASLGDRVTNFWPPRGDMTIDRVMLAGGRVGFVLKAARWLARHGNDFDVAAVMDNLTAALGANLGRRFGGPPVMLTVGRGTVEYVRCQRGLIPFPKYAAKMAATRLLVAINERRADAIGCACEYDARVCSTRNAHAVAIPWFGVDTEKFAPRWTKAEARQLLGFAPDESIVMFRSRIAPEKDPDTFLRAVKALRAEGRQFTAVFMGGEVDEMNRRAAAIGVDVVARKPASIDEIPVWYVAADVDVQTSHAEGIAVSTMESQACLTPVVATDLGGLPEALGYGAGGILVPHGDHLATAAAIARLLDDEELAATLGQQGRAHVEQGYGAALTFRRWADLMTDVANRRTTRAPGTQRKRRVLFVDHEGRLSGGERDLVDLVRALGDQVDAHAAVPDDGPLAAALRACNVTVHVVAMGHGLRAASRWDLARRPHLAVKHVAAAALTALRLARLAARVRPDVVHTNSMKAHVLAVPAAWRVRVPLVWHVRDILEPGWLARAFMLVAGAAPTRIVCLSEAAAAPFRADGAKAAAKVRVVYNGIRLEPVGPDEVIAARRQLGATNGEPIVGIVGQIAHWKGQDVFVEAAALLAGRHHDVRFAVVGTCLFPNNEREYEAGLHRRARELGLDTRLVWTGNVEPIEPVMAALDVFVHASRLPEPFGRVIVEAMASGTPVVASNQGAGPELVTPETGRLVDPGDPERLAAAVDDLVADPDGRAALRERARQRAAEFDIARTAAGVLAVYEEMSA
jgi:glycosyltransferase involved in cell wall biosynthesis